MLGRNIVIIMADDMVMKFAHPISIRWQQMEYVSRNLWTDTASLLAGLCCQQIGHSGRKWDEPKNCNRCVIISEVCKKRATTP